MCLYPKLVRNPKYKPNAKNKGKPPVLKDIRTAWVPVACGECLECRRAKAREWQVRLSEEIRHGGYHAYFVTLTFSSRALEELSHAYNLTEENEIAAKAVRLFTERYRLRNTRSRRAATLASLGGSTAGSRSAAGGSRALSLRHWLITERGHRGTERLHLHGIIFTPSPLSYEEITALWSYGYVWVGWWVNEQTINYIVKYVTKVDNNHKDFKGRIFASKGLGKAYINSFNSKRNEYIPQRTDENYILRDGRRIALPIYYRNKLYTEEQREALWLEKLNKKERYIRGIRYAFKTKEDQRIYFNALKKAQEISENLGYGKRKEKWDKKNYIFSLQNLENKK